MTVYPGTTPIPDRNVGRMPRGWAPLPPTPEERAAQYRQLAAQRRAEADQRDRDGRGGAGHRLRAQAAMYERKAAAYAVIALERADRRRHRYDTGTTLDHRR